MRFQKKKEEDLFRQLMENEEVNLDNLIEVPDLNVQDLVEEHSRSIIVHILNTDALTPEGVFASLPQIWEIDDRVQGKCVGNDRIQSIFEKEKDLQETLKMAPWYVNGWLFTGERWTPELPPDFFTKIPFWICIFGIPLHLIKEESVKCVGEALEHVKGVKLHAKHSNFFEYVRARVWLPIDEPIYFKRAMRFKIG